jgi:hypothetical protein
MFDDQHRGTGDGPTVGIILCAAKDASIVRYSVLHGNEKLFATRYKLVLPTEEQLRVELIREQRWLEEQYAASSGSTTKKKNTKSARTTRRSRPVSTP